MCVTECVFVSVADEMCVCVCLQRQDGEPDLTYNTLGPNVCMGDHKVPGFRDTCLISHLTHTLAPAEGCHV